MNHLIFKHATTREARSKGVRASATRMLPQVSNVIWILPTNAPRFPNTIVEVVLKVLKCFFLEM